MGWAHWVCGQPKRLSIYHCNPLLSIAQKACSVPRLLRHSVSGLGGIRGVRGAQCTANGKRQRVGGALRYHGPCIFISFSALEQGGPSGGCPAPSYHFGVQGYASTPFYPSPLVTRGPKTKKPLNQRLIFFRTFFSDIELISF